MNITLIVFLAILLASIAIAILSRRGLVRSNLQDVMVANRTMGGFLVFFITAGEIYGIGTMIGLPGAIYSKGASQALWFLGYILLGYPVGYFITPLIWRIGKISNASTLSDLVEWRFNSANLALILSILSVVLMLPFTMMQFAGMGIIVQYLGINIDKATAVILAAAIGFIYLIVAGIRAPAWVSILKDTLMLAAIVIGGVIAVRMMPGGVSEIFATAARQFPSHMTVSTSPTVIIFVMTTIVFNMLGFPCIPSIVQFALAARSEDVLRRNQLFMPLYMLMYPFIIIGAYYTLITVRHLNNPDQAFMALVKTNASDAVVGVVAAGGALTCILIIAVKTLSIATLISKNIIGHFKRSASDNQIILWAWVAAGVIMLAGVVITLFGPNLLLGFLLLSYYAITQLVPLFVCSIWWKRATAVGVGAGLIAGIVCVTYITVAKFSLLGINSGLLALIVNAIVTIVVSYATKVDIVAQKRVEQFQSYYDTSHEADAIRISSSAIV